MVPVGDTSEDYIAGSTTIASIDTYVRGNLPRFLTAPIFRVPPVLVNHLLIVDLLRQETLPSEHETEITLIIVEQILFYEQEFERKAIEVPK